MFSRIFIFFLVFVAPFRLLGVPRIDANDLERTGDVINYAIVQKNNVSPDAMGKGVYGLVYKGFWQGTPVAIKKYYLKTLPTHLAAEYDVYDKAKHPYIVPVHGICDEPGKFNLVYEFHPYNLREYINGENYKPSMDFIIPNARRLARVISFLHSRQLMLESLKSPNILLDENLEIKVADFGLSKLKASNTDASGSIRWRAPESFKRKYTYQNSDDIYAFGIVFWEMLTGQKPFADLKEPDVLIALKAGARPPINDSWSKEIKDLLNMCWNAEPTKRPNADDLLKYVEEKFKGFTDNVAITDGMQPKLVDQGKVTVVLMKDKKEVKKWLFNLSDLSGQKLVPDEQELLRFEKTSGIKTGIPPQHILIQYPITAYKPVAGTPLSTKEQ